jgi:hypothetical protein
MTLLTFLSIPSSCIKFFQFAFTDLLASSKIMGAAVRPTFSAPLHSGNIPLAREWAGGGVEGGNARSTVRHLEVVVVQALLIQSLHLRE